MKQQGRLIRAFKCQVVEEPLSGVSGPAQLLHRDEITSALLCHAKRQYARGGCDNPSNKESAREERIRQLEQLVDRLTLENVPGGCELMSLLRSTYYYRPKKEPRDETEYTNGIEAIIEELPGYGNRRTTKMLHCQGISAKHKKALRIFWKPKCRWVRSANSDHACRIYQNLTKQYSCHPGPGFPKGG